MLKPNAVKSFQEYAEEVFVKFIQWQLQSLKRIDILWDRYLANSIKESHQRKMWCWGKMKSCCPMEDPCQLA